MKSSHKLLVILIAIVMVLVSMSPAVDSLSGGRSGQTQTYQQNTLNFKEHLNDTHMDNHVTSLSNIVFSSDSTLNANIISGNLTIDQNVILNTNGHSIILSGNFVNHGTVITGYANNSGGAAFDALQYPQSYGGSGGGDTWEFSQLYHSTSGGTLAQGGYDSYNVNAGDGSQATIAIPTDYTLINWFSNGIQKYVTGGGGAGGMGYFGGSNFGGDGANGILIEASNIVAGNISAVGQDLYAGGTDNSPGAGGGGVIILAYGTGGYTPGTYSVEGGVTAPNQYNNNLQGGNGGSGQVMAFYYGTMEPISPVPSATFSGIYSGSLVFSHNSTLNHDVYASSFTIEKGVTLVTDGYNIFVTGTFSNYGNISTGVSVPGTALYGITLPQSYGGSGGGGAGSSASLSAPGLPGYATLVAGGLPSGGYDNIDPHTGYNGNPSADLSAISGALLTQWYSSLPMDGYGDGLTQYLTGSSGGLALNGNTSSVAGGGGYGLYVQANRIVVGNITSAGAQSSTGDVSGSGAGGAGSIILAYGNGGISSKGIIDTSGGEADSSSFTYPGGNGGNGFCLAFNYSNKAPIQIGIAYTLTFKESGLPATNIWAITLNGQTEASIGNNPVTFSETKGSYSYYANISFPNEQTSPAYFYVGSVNNSGQSGDVSVNGNMSLLVNYSSIMLLIRIENVNGNSAATMSGTVTASISSASSGFAENNVSMDREGYVEWTSLPTGSYHVAFYHIPENGLDLKEYWGSVSVQVNAYKTSFVKFERNTPWIDGTTLSVSSIVGNQSNSINVKVVNPSEFYGNFVIAYVVFNRTTRNIQSPTGSNGEGIPLTFYSNVMLISNNSSATFEVPFSISESGNYYYYVYLKTMLDGNAVITDQYNWSKQQEQVLGGEIFNVTFHEENLPYMSWYITLDNVTLTSYDQNIVFHEPIGTYQYQIQPVGEGAGVEYLSQTQSGNLSVSDTNVNISVRFDLYFYLLLSISGYGRLSNSSGYYRALSTVNLTVLGGILINWDGSGAGNYTGNKKNISLVMKNTMEEVALFTAPDNWKEVSGFNIAQISSVHASFNIGPFGVLSISLPLSIYSISNSSKTSQTTFVALVEKWFGINLNMSTGAIPSHSIVLLFSISGMYSILRNLNSAYNDTFGFFDHQNIVGGLQYLFVNGSLNFAMALSMNESVELGSVTGVLLGTLEGAILSFLADLSETLLGVEKVSFASIIGNIAGLLYPVLNGFNFQLGLLVKSSIDGFKESIFYIDLTSTIQKFLNFLNSFSTVTGNILTMIAYFALAIDNAATGNLPAAGVNIARGILMGVDTGLDVFVGNNPITDAFNWVTDIVDPNGTTIYPELTVNSMSVLGYNNGSINYTSPEGFAINAGGMWQMVFQYNAEDNLTLQTVGSPNADVPYMTFLSRENFNDTSASGFLTGGETLTAQISGNQNSSTQLAFGDNAFIANVGGIISGNYYYITGKVVNSTGVGIAGTVGFYINGTMVALVITSSNGTFHEKIVVQKNNESITIELDAPGYFGHSYVVSTSSFSIQKNNPGGFPAYMIYLLIIAVVAALGTLYYYRKRRGA